jgi:CysZ protein
VTALPRGARFIFEQRRCWPAAAAPALILLLLAVPVLWLSVARFGPWLSSELLPDPGTWYAESAQIALRWLSSALAAYLGLWLALLRAPLHSAPALSGLGGARERALGARARAPQSFWFELRCGLEAQVGGLLLALPLWLLSWAAAAALPGAGLLLVPLQALPLAVGLAWNLLDYPLTLHGVRVRERWALLRRAPLSILGFGFCLAAVSVIPGAALLLLPAGVVGATDLVAGLLPGSGHLLASRVSPGTEP